MKKKDMATLGDKIQDSEGVLAGKRLNRKILIAIFLLFFISIVLIRNTYYIKLDAGPEISDNQYIRSLYYYRAFFMDESLNLRSNFYPPLVYLTTQIYYLFLGAGQEVSRLSISFFMLIFLLAMFGIGYELGGAFSGAATMALAASSPYVLDISVKYFLDFPCAAMVALSLYLLLKTDSFRNRKFSLLFGLVFASALLTKNFTVFYMFFPILWLLLPNITKSSRSLFTFLILSIPPLFMLAGSVFYINLVSRSPFDNRYIDRWFIYYLAVIFLPAAILAATAWLFDTCNKDSGADDKEAISGLINFSGAFAIFTVGAMPWYFWALRANIFYFNLQKHDQCMMVGDNAYFSILRAGLLNLLSFIANSFNMAVVLIVIGLIFFIIKRKHLHRNLAVFLGLIFSIIIMSITLHYQFRYLLPMIAFLAGLGGYWISYTGRAKHILMALIVGVSLVSILVWVPIQPVRGIFVPHDTKSEEPEILRAGILYPYPPENQEIYEDKVLQFMFPDDTSLRKKILFYYFQMADPVYIYYFQGEALKKDKIIKLIDMWRDEDLKHPENDPARFSGEFLNSFADTEYIVTLHKDEDPGNALDAFNKFYPRARFRSRTFEISDRGHYMTVSRVIWK